MSEKPPILHILVVGFHHKKGCQVEFSYPPLIAGTEGKNECPSGWKYLPTLGLPDGSHNFTEDTVFFNLPSLLDPTESIYGVSCYRQIPVEKLKNRTADVTRSTVQKSVCVLSRLPIYGYIEVKLALIADAFFEQGDFSSTEILVKAYNQLNACLLDESRPLRHFYVGLSLREIVLKWRHKSLILFKLFLLQKRVIFFGSPVRSMCALILGISSLIPRLLEKGFQEVACVRTSRPLSPMPNFTISADAEYEISDESKENEENLEPPEKPLHWLWKQEEPVEEKSEIIEELENSEKCESLDTFDLDLNKTKDQVDNGTPKLVRVDSNGTEVGKRIEHSNSLTREASVDTLASTLFPLSSISPDAYRSPVSIFASGHLCLPYLSLPYMDLLSDPSVLSYVIGTSNVLFQQKKFLADILVDVENGNMEATDQDLRRQLVLTTEDLRFIDYVIRHVQNPKEDAEGSENWIREQFQGYILALLKTAAAQEISKDNDHFNGQYMAAFKKTPCFQEWYDVRPEAEFFEALPSGHPFAGTLSVADMKLKIAQTMQNSEGGRKLEKAVNNTSRAVGGAISQAKGALSNWWSSMTTQPALSQQDTTVTFQNSENSVQIGDGFKSFLRDMDDVPEGDEDESQSRAVDNAQEVVEKETPPPAKKAGEGIVEIAKEAELLESNREKNGDVFVV